MAKEPSPGRNTAMTRFRGGDFALSAIGIALAVFAYAQIGLIPERSFGDPLGARLMPTICVSLLFIISLIIGVHAALGTPRTEDAPSEPSRPLAVAAVLAGAIVYTLAMPYLGYYVSTWLFTLGIIFIGRPGAWIANLLGASIITAIFYVVFGWTLAVSFPRGMLGF
jgi:hypothetical protein